MGQKHPTDVIWQALDFYLTGLCAFHYTYTQLFGIEDQLDRELNGL